MTACQSALSLFTSSIFNGVAQSLISHRIPAVVAMQYKVNVSSATAFAEQFYRSLGERDSFALAVSQGREAMGVEGNQWYRPVLYLRWKDNEGGQLFSMAELTTSLQPGLLINTQQNIQKFLNKLPSPSSIQPFVEDLESLRKETYCYKQAKRWLENENFRLKLAAKIAKATLKGKSLGFYPTLEAKQEAEDDFEWNVYNCITCLFESFSTYWDKDVCDNFKVYLIEHIKLYIDALSCLKIEVEEAFSNNKDVIDLIHQQIDVFIEKISV